MISSASASEPRVISDCHSAAQPNHFTPGSRSYSVALFSKVAIGFIPKRAGGELAGRVAVAGEAARAEADGPGRDRFLHAVGDSLLLLLRRIAWARVTIDSRRQSSLSTSCKKYTAVGHPLTYAPTKCRHLRHGVVRGPALRIAHVAAVGAQHVRAHSGVRDHGGDVHGVRQLVKGVPARARNRRFWRLSALRAHGKPP